MACSHQHIGVKSHVAADDPDYAQTSHSIVLYWCCISYLDIRYSGSQSWHIIAAAVSRLHVLLLSSVSVTEIVVTTLSRYMLKSVSWASPEGIAGVMGPNPLLCLGYHRATQYSMHCYANTGYPFLTAKCKGILETAAKKLYLILGLTVDKGQFTIKNPDYSRQTDTLLTASLSRTSWVLWLQKG